MPVRPASMSVVAMVFGEYFSHLVRGHAENVWLSKGVAAILIGRKRNKLAPSAVVKTRSHLLVKFYYRENETALPDKRTFDFNHSEYELHVIKFLKTPLRQ